MISQTEGARLMAAHWKHVRAEMTLVAVFGKTDAVDALRKAQKAQAAFEKLVAQLTDSEGL